MPPEIPSHFTINDFFLFFIYIGIILIICQEIKIKNAHIPFFKFFIYGIFAKIIGAILVCYVYMYHYPGGGDTTGYFYNSQVLGNLLFKHPNIFFKIIFLGDTSNGTFSIFDTRTGWPDYAPDYFSFFFVRLITPINIFSFGSYIACSVLLASISYLGVWKLYSTFCEEFPSLINEMAIAILFIPSVVFYGSGILKDTVTFSCMGWFIYGLYNILKKRYSLKYFLILLISGYLLLSIKPYILYGLLAASSVWLAAHYLKQLPLPIIRFIYAPAIILLFTIVSSLLILKIGQNKGNFSPDQLQQEMTKRRTYIDSSPPGSMFDIKPIENSFSSLTKNAPIIIGTTLFRPYLWEVKNAMILVFALENMFLLFFFFLLLYKFRIIYIFPSLFSNPFLVFSFCFILILSFVVGISTSNFGSLARFRIPVIPFYVASCFILNSIHKEKAKRML